MTAGLLLGIALIFLTWVVANGKMDVPARSIVLSLAFIPKHWPVVHLASGRSRRNENFLILFL